MVRNDGTRRMGVTLTVDSDTDHEELDALTQQLRDRLLELEVDRVELERSQTPPAGSKPGEVIALGSLLVVAAPFALRSIIRLLEKWIEHRPVRTVSVTLGDDSIELQTVSSKEQRRLIELFVSQHGTDAIESQGSSQP
ncbi:hypothetical protein [Streptomyces sp. NBC_01314]|uniref:effector-associated constant component EACC1 n=1 Tax=Streptomyces sp. NBC_01314 TaxID=2903821 RepID=UPI00308906D1|nr:hypothetical protein OG622_28230 [Streptomyces sp. NBC_01314]